ncbi:MAG: permease, partial [bacterium]
DAPILILDEATSALGGIISSVLKNKIPGTLAEGNCLFTSSVGGSLLPPCPFISWPIIKSFRRGGMGLPGTLIMLAAASTVEFFQLFAGLAIFGFKIVILRLSFGFLSILLTGFLLLLVTGKLKLADL